MVLPIIQKFGNLEDIENDKKLDELKKFLNRILSNFIKSIDNNEQKRALEDLLRNYIAPLYAIFEKNEFEKINNNLKKIYDISNNSKNSQDFINRTYENYNKNNLNNHAIPHKSFIENYLSNNLITTNFPIRNNIIKYKKLTSEIITKQSLFIK